MHNSNKQIREHVAYRAKYQLDSLVWYTVQNKVYHRVRNQVLPQGIVLNQVRDQLKNYE